MQKNQIKKSLETRQQSKDKTQKKDIFEDLFQLTNCSFISDLTAIANYKQIIKGIQKLEEDEYTIKKWKDLYQYLTGYEYCSLNNNIKEDLIQFLEKKSSEFYSGKYLE